MQIRKPYFYPSTKAICNLFLLPELPSILASFSATRHFSGSFIASKLWFTTTKRFSENLCTPVMVTGRLELLREESNSLCVTRPSFQLNWRKWTTHPSNLLCNIMSLFYLSDIRTHIDAIKYFERIQIGWENRPLCSLVLRALPTFKAIPDVNAT